MNQHLLAKCLELNDRFKYLTDERERLETEIRVTRASYLENAMELAQEIGLPEPRTPDGSYKQYVTFDNRFFLVQRFGNDVLISEIKPTPL